MKYIYILILIGNICIANELELESLDNEVRVLYSYGHIKEAFKKNILLKKLAKIQSNEFYRVKSLINNIEIYTYKGEYIEACDAVNTVEKIEITNKDLLFYFYESLSKFYYFSSKPSLGYKYINLCIQVSENSTNIYIKNSRILKEIFILFDVHSLNFGPENKYYVKEEIFTLFDKLKQSYDVLSPELKATYHSYNIYFKSFYPEFENDYLDAVDDFLKAIETNNFNNQIEIYGMKYRYYKNNYDNIKAEKYLFKMDSISKLTETHFYQLVTIQNISKHYYNKNELDKALEYIYKFDNKTGFTYSIYFEEIDELTSDIFEKMNQADSALFYQKKYLEKTQLISNFKNETLKSYINNNLIIKINSQNSDLFNKNSFIGILLSFFILTILGVSFFIFKQKKYLKTNKKSIEKLALSNDKLEKYSILASNKLKTPINNIASYCNSVLNDADNDLTYTSENNLKKINKITEHTLKDIKGIMLYNQFFGKKNNEIKFEKTNLFRVVENAISLILNLNKNTKFSYKNKLSINSYLYGNEILLIELFQNIFENSIKFSIPKGRIKIEIFQIEENIENKIHFVIKDYGIGVDVKNLDKIFIKGFQEKQVHETFGLGLEFCKQIVEEYHYGKIWCESEKDIFTEIHIILPIKKES